MTYLRDRLTVARDLLAESGSIFVQIGDENVHRVRGLMDEVFGENNFIAQIGTKTSGGSTGEYLPGVMDFVIWFAKDGGRTKYKPLFGSKELGEDGAEKYSRVRLPNLETRSLSLTERDLETALPAEARVYRQDNLTSQSIGRDKGEGAASWFPVSIAGQEIRPSLKVRWKTNELGMARLLRAGRVEVTGNSLSYVRYLDDFSASALNNVWADLGGIQSRADPKVYVVQTPTTLIQRCVLLTTDPGDLVLDPTCGSGTTAYVAEQWGRRWITIDTSRVALALARARIMGARYPYYLLADSRDGQFKEAEVTRTVPSAKPVHGNIRHGFVYERVPHITLRSIANNAEIDVIWENWQKTLESLRGKLNAALKTKWEEWEILRQADDDWPATAKKLHVQWWEARIGRQKEMDASIAAKAEFEYLYDKPYEDRRKVRVAGPFTVESLSPHRILGVDENDELIDPIKKVP
jgi:adenine-specific DNA-methyltransferase